MSRRAYIPEHKSKCSFFEKLANAVGVNSRSLSADKYLYFQKKNMSGGFTLVELLISITIFVLVTTVAVYNNSQFNSSVLLTNLAYEVALSVRQAQFYGISIKNATSTVATYNVFNSGFGVHFDRNTNKYTFFEDRAPNPNDPSSVPNSVFDSGEGVEVFNLRKGNQIGKICLGSGMSCSNDNSVDISFKRPNPDAIIISGVTSYSKASICISSANGVKRKVVVDITGQISVIVDGAGTAICN